jgi:hypothetical protein
MANNRYLTLHHKAFRADYISHITKIRAPSAARIRAYSGYEIANTPVQDAGKHRKVQFEYQAPCTKSKVS